MMQRQITIEELSKKLKPILGSKIDELYFRYTTSESQEERTEILQILTALYQRNLSKLLDSKVLLEPPQKNLQGKYPLAKIIYNEKEVAEFGLNEKDWPRHVCVSGMSGSGKTTFALNVLKNFIEKDKPFLVFDWKKSFRPLNQINQNVLTFTVGNDGVSNLFKMNINRPPKGVSPKEWINTLCDLLTESFSVSFGVHKVLLETLDEMFEKWGIYKGEKHYPNWQHIKRMLEIKSKDARGRETQWYESALRIATVLTFGAFGKVINYDGKKSLPVEDLFDKKVIFELNSLGNIEKKFFCEFVLAYIYKLKKAQENKVDSDFNFAILVDEAHNIFLKNKTNFLSESVTDMVYREMREYGISLICLDQHISKLSDTVKGNSACHIAFQQQLPEDIRDISELMQLVDRKEFFSRLPVGTAIVKLSERYNSPFLVKAPFTDLRNSTMSDEKISQKMNCIIKGIEIEKQDPEFMKAITEPIQEVIVESPKEILNSTQKVLYEFVLKKLTQEKSLKEIEALLESGLNENSYTALDVLIVINHALNEKLKFEEPQDFQEVEIAEDLPNELDTNEKKFLSFIKMNPEHEHTTVEIYKRLNLSTRKGNIIKNELLDKGLIKIQEIKNTKGWKKLIQPM